MHLLGLDIGTTGCKSIIYTLDGKIVSQAYRENKLHHPKPGWAEYKVDEIWSNVKEALKESLTKSRLDPKEIAGVSISSQAETLIPVDHDGKWLYPAIVWLDQRGEEQCKWWEENFGNYNLYRITGQHLHPMYSVNKIIWLRENMPRIYKKTAKFPCIMDYVIYKLSGKFATDYSVASRTMMFDVKKRKWSSEILQAAEIEQDHLSKPHLSGTVVGEVLEDASKQTGLLSRTPVAVGGHDHLCGALAVGIAKPGVMLDSTGTAESMVTTLDKPFLERELFQNHYNCYCHVIKGKYVIHSRIATSGAILGWFRDEFGKEEVDRAQKIGKDPYDLLLEKALSSKPGASGLFFFPHFGNFRGAILGLALSTTKADIIRSIIEGFCFELRYKIECLEKLMESKITEVRAIGGAAKSEFWLKTKANITGKRVIVPKVTEAASLGAAILAGIGTGIYRGVEDALKRIYRVAGIYEPDRNLLSMYSEYYKVYREISAALKEIWSKTRTF